MEEIRPKTMKILLIQPPLQDFYQTRIRTQPIGLAYLAASLMRHGHEVEIVDCQTEKKKSISIPPELSFLKEFYPFNDQSPFKLYSGYYHFGMDWDEIRKKIENSNADVFGISSSFTPYHGMALKVAGIIKGWDKGKTVIMGGPHASCDPEGTLQSSLVDYVVLGEGEIRFPLLLEKIKEGKIRGIQEIDGIGYREKEEIRVNPLKTFVEDLDTLPFPSRELLDPDRYRVTKKRSTMIITSRGCPHGCAYCSARLVMGASFRTRPPESILQEMAECREKYGIEVFDIEDDNFTFDQARARQLMGLIIETFGEGNLQLSAMNGVSFASLDGDLLRLMKKAGFQTINLSFVSTEAATTRRLGRPREGACFEDILRGVEQAGLQAVAYAILGMPGQTIEEMVDTLIYLMGKRVLIGPSIYYPTPGTPLFEKCKKDDVLPSYQSQWRSSGFPIETEDFDRLDMVTIFRLSRVINFVKGKIDANALNNGMTWKEVSQVLGEKAKVHNKREDAPCGSSDRLLEENSRGFEPCGKDKAFSWNELLSLLIQEKFFFSLRKDPGRGFSTVKERSSKRVLDFFFEKAWESPILGTR